ncbi:hypothetical protein CHUAL_006378 [Chamberlinius hualienensis]
MGEVEEDKLQKLAVEAILKETHRAAVRAREVGSTGWMKCPLPTANKRFINNTLLSTLSSIKRQDVNSKRIQKVDKLKTCKNDSGGFERRELHKRQNDDMKHKCKSDRRIDQTKRAHNTRKPKEAEDSHKNKRRKHEDSR